MSPQHTQAPDGGLILDEITDTAAGDDVSASTLVASNDDSESIDTSEAVKLEDIAGTAAIIATVKPRRAAHAARVTLLGVLPVLALLLAGVGGYLKWVDGTARASQQAQHESVTAASESTVALLSYQPDTADKALDGARDRLTGNFRDAYTSLIHDVVIPGAKQKNISAIATVPAAASVSATESHAVALIFVDQTITVGNDAPSSTASAVKVTLDKVGGRWLISEFQPV
jgi:Mce-associated membrane protein